MHAHFIDFTFYIGEEVDLQSLVKHLLNIAPKWQLIGEQLGVSDTVLDEIFTNYESDHDCLIQMLDFWLRKHHSHPTWREIISALHLMEEHAYAESLEHMGKPHYIIPFPTCYM